MKVVFIKESRVFAVEDIVTHHQSVMHAPRTTPRLLTRLSEQALNRLKKQEVPYDTMYDLVNTILSFANVVENMKCS